MGTYFASASADLVIFKADGTGAELSRRTIFTNQPINREFDMNWWSIVLKPEEITTELLFKDNISFKFELTYVTRAKDLDYTDLFSSYKMYCVIPIIGCEQEQAPES